MKPYLNTDKTVRETIEDLTQLISDMGGSSFYAIPEEDGVGYKVLFRYESKAISISSRRQPSRAGNLRMCYRAIRYVYEMRERGVLDLVTSLTTEMGLVPVLSDGGDLSVERAILGVGTDATHEQITKAYREKAQLVHPDSSKGARDSDLFKGLDTAYKKLLEGAR